MVQRPVRELTKLRGSRQQASNLSFDEANAWLANHKTKGELFELQADFEVITNAGNFTISMGTAPGEQTVVRRSVDGRLSLDRTRSGKTDFHPKFPGVHEAMLPSRNGHVTLHLFLDTSSIEVFGNDGEVVLTDLILASSNARNLTLTSNGEAPRVRHLDLWELKPAWQGKGPSQR